VRGLVSRTELVVEKVGLAALAAFVLTTVMLGMVRPSCGMMISCAMIDSRASLAAHHRADLRYNLFDSRDHLALEKIVAEVRAMVRG